MNLVQLMADYGVMLTETFADRTLLTDDDKPSYEYTFADVRKDAYETYLQLVIESTEDEALRNIAWNQLRVNEGEWKYVRTKLLSEISTQTRDIKIHGNTLRGAEVTEYIGDMFVVRYMHLKFLINKKGELI